MFLLSDLNPGAFNSHLGWFLFAIILVCGVAVGARDLIRFRFRRVWAISSVCFDESIRRKVLWITPLAILGVIIVAQLQRPLDEQDAIRQTTKFCLFATGLIVTIAIIILACTNLPREIENRVIYTVVTKPTTRFEIVLGKVIGFAKVSLLILIIMGGFTAIYLNARAWSMHREIAAKLEAGDVSPSAVPTMEYYRDAGLLNAKTLKSPEDLQIYARVPADSGSRRYMLGNSEGSFEVPFDVDPQDLASLDSTSSAVGVLVVAHVGYVRKSDKSGAILEGPPKDIAHPEKGSTTTPYYGPFIMSPEERAAVMASTKHTALPSVSIQVLDSDEDTIGAASPLPPSKTIELHQPNDLETVRAVIPAKIAARMRGRIYIRVLGDSPDADYFVDLAKTPVPIGMAIVAAPNQPPIVVPPAPDPFNSAQPAGPIFQARTGTYGMQVRGGPSHQPTAIYRFRNTPVVADNNEAPFELRAGIERSGDEADANYIEPTRVGVRIRNFTTHELSPERIIQPESNRTLFFRMPASATAGGNFDVLVRCLTTGDLLGIKTQSLSLVVSHEPFLWNLVKSLFILWLMAILVVAVSIFCSTFLSWPIAVVLTLVILLGHWGVEQLGDATAPGIGNQVVMDFGLRSPAKAEAVRATVEKLSSFLNFISTILPDISQYPAVDNIQDGISIPTIDIRSAADVTFGFGLPLVLLAYVFLKNKEVAP